MNKEHIKQMRKTAFEIGVARYFYEHDTAAQVKVAASQGAYEHLKVASPLLLAALPSMIAYGGGSAGGDVAGSAYGLATGVSAETIGEREYQLAEASTQQLIDELRAKQHNKSIKGILSRNEPGQARNPALSWIR